MGESIWSVLANSLHLPDTQLCDTLLDKLAVQLEELMDIETVKVWLDKTNPVLLSMSPRQYIHSSETLTHVINNLKHLS